MRDRPPPAPRPASEMTRAVTVVGGHLLGRKPMPTPRRLARWALALGLVVALLPLALPARRAQAKSLSRSRASGPGACCSRPIRCAYPGDVPPVLSQATAAMPSAAQAGSGGDGMTITVVLRRTDEAGFDAFVRGVTDPHSPTHGRYLSQDEQSRALRTQPGRLPERPDLAAREGPAPGGGLRESTDDHGDRDARAGQQRLPDADPRLPARHPKLLREQPGSGRCPARSHRRF